MPTKKIIKNFNHVLMQKKNHKNTILYLWHVFKLFLLKKKTFYVLLCMYLCLKKVEKV